MEDVELDASILDWTEEAEIWRKIREEKERMEREQLEKERLRFSKKLNPPRKDR